MVSAAVSHMSASRVVAVFQAASLLSRPRDVFSSSYFAAPLRVPGPVGRSLVVRCDTGEGNRSPLAAVQKSSPSLTGIQEAVDKSTKEGITRRDIERNQAETTSEKRSFLGTQPASTMPWPRPEVERRPETGDRSLGSIFAVDGAAPETINGRMAMLGFVWALVAEKLTGLTVVEQLFNPATSGVLYFGAIVQLFTVASVIPFVCGESTDARRWGPFNAKAERWNGRLAMLGFAALVIDELIRQGPLIH